MRPWIASANGAVDNFGQSPPCRNMTGASGLTVKAAPKKISLDDLLDQVTPENLHPATDWGADVGREVLPP